MSVASCRRVLRLVVAVVAVCCVQLAARAAGAEEGDSLESFVTFKEGDGCVAQETGASGVCTQQAECASLVNDPGSATAVTACHPSKNPDLVCCETQLSPGHGRSTTRVSDIKCDEYTAEPYLSPAAGDFPHMAAIGWRTLGGNVSFLCGGALISERFVLTAGHCLQTRGNSRLADQTPSLVRLGVVNVGDALLTVKPGVLDVPIKARISHPSYKPTMRYFDLGLLELAEAVPFTGRHRPACLWTRPDFSPHSRAIITSWTNTDDRDDEALELIKTQVEMWAQATCEQELASSRGKSWSGLQDYQFCTGEPTETKCEFGDSGGPVQVQTDKHYSILGMTSFGKGCNLNRPGVNTRLAAFLDWIEEVVWPEYTHTAIEPQ